MFKLSVADKIVVPVKFSLQDGKKTKPFAFTLTCDRLTTVAFQERIKSDSGYSTNEKIREVMTEITSDWQNQTLVLGEDSEPAEFCPEALEVMFDTSGVLDVVVTSYMKESAARSKN